MTYLESPSKVEMRQLFITKNDVLRAEVRRSFLNMGLAWRRRLGHLSSIDSDKLWKKTKNKANHNIESEASPTSANNNITFPLFLTAVEWLDILDFELPGENFFSPNEIEYRLQTRREDDIVQQGLESFFATDAGRREETITVRREMNFQSFLRLWPKINSKLKAELDPSLVWLEIKSHIKGSVLSLHLAQDDRMNPSKRFLGREEYLALPRKQSRLSLAQRGIVFSLYESYERLKKLQNFYDEMDIVYNLAGRVGSFDSKKKSLGNIIPVDTIFVDEVQDFTQVELYLLTQLCGNPNNLMLAGDTAQSIAVGVGFRFTDVRQIFYHAFGGMEPDLLRLTHNYRSHAGILKLAASVVELLYFFFSDSLDKLPPDFGLFDGPKPVLVEVTSVADLVLMLDGSKRETTRIEFGAHQVVIVRNQEAKNSLPEEFGVDKDWVMTVSFI